MPNLHKFRYMATPRLMSIAFSCTRRRTSDFDAAIATNPKGRIDRRHLEISSAQKWMMMSLAAITAQFRLGATVPSAPLLLNAALFIER